MIAWRTVLQQPNTNATVIDNFGTAKFAGDGATDLMVTAAGMGRRSAITYTWFCSPGPKFVMASSSRVTAAVTAVWPAAADMGNAETKE
jgi:hypothetical protein